MMNPSTMFFFLFFTGSFIDHVSSTATQVSDAHCSSIFPDVVPSSGFGSHMFETETAHAGFYLGGNPNPNLSLTSYTNSFSFSISWTRKTNKDDVLMIGATMVPGSPLISGSYFRRRVSYSSLQGFWSISSGKLCVVGTVAFFVSGNQHSLAAALKVNNFKNSSSITSLITGTLECLSSSHDRNYFEPLSVLMIPRLAYEYTLVPGKSGDWFSSGSDTEQNLPLNTLPGGSFCSVMPGVENVYFLNYTSNCSSAKNCLPFSGVVGSLPAFVSLRRIECLEVNKTIRVLVEFLNYSYDGFSSSWLFDLNMSMIGEGFWDDKKNVLYVSLCQFLGITEPWSNAHIGDCTARLSLRLPAILSIKQNSRFLGQIWSHKAVNDSGYFNRIEFQSTEDRIRGVPGLKYEYSEINRVKNLCPTKPGGNKGDIYPSGYSHDIEFDMNIENSKGERGWGFASPLSVGDRFYRQGFPLVALPPLSSATVVPSSRENSGPVNISYKIDITIMTGVVDSNISDWIYKKVEIAAEGIFDSGTGRLCMVGCRKIQSNKNNSGTASVDCEVLLNFRFSSLKPNATGGYVKGSIESRRKKSDPLYFERLDVSSAAYSEVQARESIRRMDLEITMVLISNTLSCIFVGFQLYHVKKHLEVLPSISMVMLLILTLGQMVPLLLNFEALFSKNHAGEALISSGEWLETNEVVVRIITMVAFLLLLRLLQLTWSIKSNDGDQKAFFAEKMTLIVSVPLYAVGAFITLSVNWRKNRHGVLLLSSHQYHQHSLWKNLKSYAGLVLDCFLLPQLLLNMFLNSKENALSPPFYIGTTFLRLLPHAYDLYRSHNFVPDYDLSYIYATPSADFYSMAWDVIIPLGGLLFAAIIYLQQRFGGRCILPRRFREPEAYDKVPVTCDLELQVEF
ncbi:hypothetical protein SLA2020_396080 [Shorea laevis]